MKIKINQVIELDQDDIISLIVIKLQDIGKLTENVEKSNVNFSLENGKVKCTIVSIFDK